MDTTKKKKTFKRLPIYFDNRQYSRDVTECNWQMVHLNSALSWCGKYVNTSTFDMVRFKLDPMSEFLMHLKEENKDKIQLEVSAHKIADLLEIDMSPFIKDINQIRKYQRFTQYVVWNEKENEWEQKLPKENYTRFTENEDDNEKLSVIEELNTVLEKIGKWKHVYPLNIMQGTSGFVEYNNELEKFILNTKTR